MDGNDSAQKSKSVIDGIVSNAKMVITNPVEFYRTMPKVGGLGDPLVFAVVLGAIAGIVMAVIGFVMSSGGMRWTSLSYVILGPVGALIGSFIGAAILFVIWKIMGSNENYEVAYRCGAYSCAIMPITLLAGIVPYVGTLVGLAWGLYLIVTASVEVHKIAAKTAWIVFGIITGIFALIHVRGEMALRHASSSIQQLGAQNEELAAQMNKTAAAMSKALEAQMKAAQAEAEKATKEAEKESDQSSE